MSKKIISAILVMAMIVSMSATAFVTSVGAAAETTYKADRDALAAAIRNFVVVGPNLEADTIAYLEDLGLIQSKDGKFVELEARKAFWKTETPDNTYFVRGTGATLGQAFVEGLNISVAGKFTWDKVPGDGESFSTLVNSNISSVIEYAASIWYFGQDEDNADVDPSFNVARNAAVKAAKGLVDKIIGALKAEVGSDTNKPESYKEMFYSNRYKNFATLSAAYNQSFGINPYYAGVISDGTYVTDSYYLDALKQYPVKWFTFAEVRLIDADGLFLFENELRKMALNNGAGVLYYDFINDVYNPFVKIFDDLCDKIIKSVGDVDSLFDTFSVDDQIKAYLKLKKTVDVYDLYMKDVYNNIYTATTAALLTNVLYAKQIIQFIDEKDTNNKLFALVMVDFTKLTDDIIAGIKAIEPRNEQLLTATEITTGTDLVNKAQKLLNAWAWSGKGDAYGTAWANLNSAKEVLKNMLPATAGAKVLYVVPAAAAKLKNFAGTEIGNDKFTVEFAPNYFAYIKYVAILEAAIDAYEDLTLSWIDGGKIGAIELGSTNRAALINAMNKYGYLVGIVGNMVDAGTASETELAILDGKYDATARYSYYLFENSIDMFNADGTKAYTSVYAYLTALCEAGELAGTDKDVACIYESVIGYVFDNGLDAGGTLPTIHTHDYDMNIDVAIDNVYDLLKTYLKCIKYYNSFGADDAFPDTQSFDWVKETWSYVSGYEKAAAALVAAIKYLTIDLTTAVATYDFILEQIAEYFALAEDTTAPYQQTEKFVYTDVNDEETYKDITADYYESKYALVLDFINDAYAALINNAPTYHYHKEWRRVYNSLEDFYAADDNHRLIARFDTNVTFQAITIAEIEAAIDATIAYMDEIFCTEDIKENVESVLYDLYTEYVKISQTEFEDEIVLVDYAIFNWNGDNGPHRMTNYYPGPYYHPDIYLNWPTDVLVGDVDLAKKFADEDGFVVVDETAEDIFATFVRNFPKAAKTWLFLQKVDTEVEQPKWAYTDVTEAYVKAIRDFTANYFDKTLENDFTVEYRFIDTCTIYKVGETVLSYPWSPYYTFEDREYLSVATAQADLDEYLADLKNFIWEEFSGFIVDEDENIFALIDAAVKATTITELATAANEYENFIVIDGGEPAPNLEDPQAQQDIDLSMYDITTPEAYKAITTILVGKINDIAVLANIDKEDHIFSRTPVMAEGNHLWSSVGAQQCYQFAENYPNGYFKAFVDSANALQKLIDNKAVSGPLNPVVNTKATNASLKAAYDKFIESTKLLLTVQGEAALDRFIAKVYSVIAANYNPGEAYTFNDYELLKQKLIQSNVVINQYLPYRVECYYWYDLTLAHVAAHEAVANLYAFNNEKLEDNFYNPLMGLLGDLDVKGFSREWAEDFNTSRQLGKAILDTINLETKKVNSDMPLTYALNVLADLQALSDSRADNSVAAIAAEKEIDLNALIEIADAIDRNNYLQDTDEAKEIWNSFMLAYTNATNISADARCSKDDIAAAAADLKNAIDALEMIKAPEGTANADTLNAKIADAEALYARANVTTDASKAALYEAIAAAKKVFQFNVDKTVVIADEIKKLDDAMKALSDTMYIGKDLKKDTKVLEMQVVAALYTEISYKQFSYATADAYEMAAADTETESAMKSAYDKVVSKYNGLKLAPVEEPVVEEPVVEVVSVVREEAIKIYNDAASGYSAAVTGCTAESKAAYKAALDTLKADIEAKADDAKLLASIVSLNLAKAALTVPVPETFDD